MIKKGFAYNDITVVPAVISDISSRSECNPTYPDGYLPIFASCMSTVVDLHNVHEFIENKITPIIPRNIDIKDRMTAAINGHWIAMSLKEFEKYFINDAKKREENGYQPYYHICVDIANGHMKSLYELCVKAKEASLPYNYQLVIMTGNIANPETYRWICENATYECTDAEGHKQIKCAIDYIRLSVGTGAQCVTSSNTSIHYPVASLIQGCKEIKQDIINILPRYKYYKYRLPKLVADGGIRNYFDVIKALALGADYVMVGSLFAGMYESAAPWLI